VFETIKWAGVACLGQSTGYACCEPLYAWQVVLILIGFLITIIALTPGARFWFDLLGKLGSLRASGPTRQ
jgi:hypothetical protein